MCWAMSTQTRNLKRTEASLLPSCNALPGDRPSDKAAEKALVAEQAELTDLGDEVQKMTEIFRQFEKLKLTGRY